MRIIAKRTLRKFWGDPAHRDAEQPLEAWYAEVTNATWQTPADIKAHYRHASIGGANRVVFNIAGNKYRLVKVPLKHWHRLCTIYRKPRGI